MWIELIIIVFRALVVCTVTLGLLTVIRNHRAHQFFRKNAPGLPVLPKPNLFLGHADRTLFAHRNYQSFGKYHEVYGKTFGFYYGRKPWASTIDLDLLKTMMIDESDDHINRALFDIPVKEIENDCIVFVENDQWRRIRKAVAPAFT